MARIATILPPSWAAGMAANAAERVLARCATPRSSTPASIQMGISPSQTRTQRGDSATGTSC